ncbi:hypothetical protein ACHAXN_004659 [Cyclotella atomus]
MKSSIRSIALIALIFGSQVQAHDRRVLRSNENIAAHIRAQEESSRFTITAEVQGSANSFTSSTVSIDVVKAHPAITEDTSILLADGSIIRFGEQLNSLDTLLVSDITTSSGRSGLSILAVDPVTHETQGIIEQKGAKSMTLHQGSDGGVATATEEEKMEMPAWECGVGKDDSLFHRALEEEEHAHHDHEHERDDHHHHHDEHQHDHHHHDHDEFDPSISAIENLSRSLRGTKVNPLNKQRVLNSNVSYNYQVDLFIEIDTKFIEQTGGGTVDAAGITLNAYNYINALVTAANVIYESEIDTHLHVNTIKLSNLYDSATGTKEALVIMKGKYGGSNWHTQGVDLQHALLGRELGGGIAYIGTLCNSDYGFGLTSGIMGDFKSLDQRVVWDLKAFMHEMGHSFSSGHTHDTSYYQPAIDTCGTTCPSTAGVKWATLMSYCHACSGDYGNIMYTFGGVYNGAGAKSEVTNWMNKPELIANQDSAHQNVDPKREAHAMYSHVSSRGSCLLPPMPDVTVTTAQYDSTFKVPSCTSASESCSSGTLLDGRANIGPAEQGKSPNTLKTCTDGTNGSYHSDESLDAIKVSSAVGGLLTEGRLAEIEVQVYAYDENADAADFYYTTNPSNPTWILIGTSRPSGRGAQSIKIRYTLPAGELQAVRVVFRYQGSASTSSPFNCPTSGYDDIDDLVFAVSSAATPNPTSKPVTNKPTSVPTSLAPTPLPSKKPTPFPTRAPTRKPSNKPTLPPTSMRPTLPLTCYNAKKIRLESTTGNHLQLFELKALSSNTNVALQGTATQSSNWSQRYTASNAIDGNENSFSHTMDSNAWLEVDLGSPKMLNKVEIVNRHCGDWSDAPGCLCRLSKAKLSLIDKDGKVIATRQFGDTCGVHTLSEFFASDAGC